MRSQHLRPAGTVFDKRELLVLVQSQAPFSQSVPPAWKEIATLPTLGGVDVLVPGNSAARQNAGHGIIVESQERQW